MSVLKFGMELLDHVVNPTQMSDVRVKNLMKEWQAERQQRALAETAAEEYYRQQHEAPRKAREAAYADFVKDRAALMSGPMNELAVRKVLAHTLPEMLVNGVNVDQVFTKYPVS